MCSQAWVSYDEDFAFDSIARTLASLAKIEWKRERRGESASVRDGKSWVNEKTILNIFIACYLL